MRPALLLLSSSLAAAACSSSRAAGVPDAGGSSDAGSAIDAAGPQPDGAVDPLAGCTKDPGAPPAQVDPNAATDPGGGTSFSLAQALAGFPAAQGALVAAIKVDDRAIRCTLDETAAPISVANFVGLARGTRPYKIGAGGWQVGRFYDGLTWHRVIPGFVIQGGDPLGDGTGGPGYDLVDENHVAEPLGTLAQAAGALPSGSQFYVVVGRGPASDYNVFGTCDTETAIEISKVPRDKSDKPLTPVRIQRIDIARCP